MKIFNCLGVCLDIGVVGFLEFLEGLFEGREETFLLFFDLMMKFRDDICKFV